MNSIRAKQQMEILDVWKNINAQVTARTGKQIAVFPDTIAPKTQRDVGAEVNVDKAVEQLNKVIEQKLGALEYLIQGIDSREIKSNTQMEKAKQDSEATGEIVPLWNGIVRTYQQPALSRDSQSAISVKVQELTPNLNAIVYGLMSAIDSIFDFIDQVEEGSTLYDGGRILNLLRSYSVYKYIAKSVDTNTFQILTVPMLETEFKNAFEDLSQDRVQMLKEYAPDATSILRSTVRNIPDFPVNDFNARIKSLEDEMGFNIPDDVIARMRRLNKPDQLVALAEVKNSIVPQLREERQGYDRQQKQIIAEAERLKEEYYEKTHNMNEVSQEIRILENQIAELESGEQEVNVEDMSVAVPQIPKEPEMPEFLSFDSLDDYNQAVSQYLDEVQIYEDGMAEIRRAEAYNEFVPELMRAESETQRQQMILSRQEEVRELSALAERLLGEWQRIADEMRDFNRTHLPRDNEAGDTTGSMKLDRKKRMNRGNLLSAVNSILQKKQRPTKTDVRKGQEAQEQAEAEARREADARRLVEEGELEEDEDSDAGFSESDEEELEADGRPDRNRLETRGLAGMRSNFGIKGGKVRKHDMYDFDDRRNENYYVKPVK
jgi:hypothetical protein